MFYLVFSIACFFFVVVSFVMGDREGGMASLILGWVMFCTYEILDAIKKRLPPPN